MKAVISKKDRIKKALNWKKNILDKHYVVNKPFNNELQGD